jgi:hypothetical protein
MNTLLEVILLPQQEVRDLVKAFWLMMDFMIIANLAFFIINNPPYNFLWELCGLLVWFVFFLFIGGYSKKGFRGQ